MHIHAVSGPAAATSVMVILSLCFRGYAAAALQAGLSFIGERGVSVAALGLQLNMYTAPALLAAAFGVVNILLVVLVLR